MSAPAGPTLVLRRETSELDGLLQTVQLVLLRHPVAAQAACRALIAEGRRFGETPEGQQWRARLAGSTLVRQGRMLWEGSALDILEDQDDVLLPSAFMDALVGAISSAEFADALRAALD